MDAGRLKEMEPLFETIDEITHRGNGAEIRLDGCGKFKVYELKRVRR